MEIEEFSTSEEDVLRRWKEYFQTLLNLQSDREWRAFEAALKQEVIIATEKKEVKGFMRKMKNEKALI